MSFIHEFQVPCILNHCKLFELSEQENQNLSNTNDKLVEETEEIKQKIEILKRQQLSLHPYSH